MENFCLTSESRWRTEYRETAVRVAGCRTDLGEGGHGEEDNAELSLKAVSFICRYKYTAAHMLGSWIANVMGFCKVIGMYCIFILYRYSIIDYPSTDREEIMRHECNESREKR